MLPTVLSSEGRKNFPEAVPVIAEIPLVLLSSEGCGKLGTTETTVWFMVEYCQHCCNCPLSLVHCIWLPASITIGYGSSEVVVVY